MRLTGVAVFPPMAGPTVAARRGFGFFACPEASDAKVAARIATARNEYSRDVSRNMLVIRTLKIGQLRR
jgi:hypothetical protein